MRAHAFGFGQFVAHDVTRQVSVQRLASALEAFVARHIYRGIVAIFQRWRGLRRCCPPRLYAK